MFSKIRNSRLIRISILLSILMFVSGLFMRQIQCHVDNAYAVTYSLGHGRGITFYLPKYYGLTPIQQEAVRFHEERHLEKGSFAWSHNDLEIDAYQYEIEKIDERIDQLRSVRGHREEIRQLLEFKLSALHFMRYYQGLETYEEAAEK